jgi:tRNA G10  N-methylase Trm11
MTSWIFILGTNPALSVEEILTVLGCTMDAVTDVGPDFVIVSTSAEFAAVDLLSRLGGTIKIGRLHQQMTSVSQVTPAVWRQTLRLDSDVSKKIIFGFSQYGLAKSAYALQGIGLKVKKLLKGEGYNARLMANKEGQLSSVAVQKNDLIGTELLIIKGTQIYLGLTEAVQDFERYGQRDYGRPERDSARGMLPPKVAQMMINLAQIPDSGSVLDPFCGLGTVAQEAWLMAKQRKIFCSDSDSQAVEQAQKNIQWLLSDVHSDSVRCKVGAVQTVSQLWPDQPFDAVVTEPYLGPARELQRSMSDVRRTEIITEISKLYLQAFQQFAKVIRPQGRVVMVWPMYQHGGRYELLPIMTDVAKLGFRPLLPEVRYSRLASELTERGTLWYHRQDQAVAREIVVWEKI